MDYLDAMREARDKELSLWTMKYNAEDDTWRYYRNYWLIDWKNAKELDSEIEHFNTLRDRAAMKAAYDAAQTAHWGNPLAKLGNPKSWGDMNEAEKMAAWEEAFTKRTGSPALEAAKYRKALALQRGDYREQVGDGVALMSISHPEPCGLFPEKEETQAERIARVTREMCGG